jgi:hypothetical protein
MFGYRKHFTYFGISLLSAAEICYLLLWISSSHGKGFEWSKLLAGFFWVPVIAIPTWIFLTPVFWIAFGLLGCLHAYLTVKRLSLRIRDILISSIMLALSAMVASLIWFGFTVGSMLHSQQIAIFFCLGGGISATVFGLLSSFSLRQQRKSALRM